MIRITVSLVSAIDPSRDRLLGIAEIANEGALDPSGRFCRYDVRLSKWAPREAQTWKRSPLILSGTETLEGMVDRFDREQRGPWDLLYLALKAVVGRRNG